MMSHKQGGGREESAFVTPGITVLTLSTSVLFLSTEGSLVNKETYQPYTLVRPTVTRPVQDPLAVLLFDNRINMEKGEVPERDWLNYTIKVTVT